MSELARVVDLLRQGREARRRELAPSGAIAPPDSDAIGLKFRPGERVFDRVSGETGVVLGGNRENIIDQSSE